MSTEHLDVLIMGRDYRVACAPEEHDQLLKVVALVDQKMKDIASRTRNPIPERVAVMAAMSIAHELLAKPVAESVGVQVGTNDAEDVLPSSDSLYVSEALQARLDLLVGRIDAVLQDSSALH